MVVERILGKKGKILGSKGAYTHNNPRNIVIFNANVCVETKKVWHGDIDITKEYKKLIKLQKDLNKTIYILYEMSGRFKNEENPLIHNYAFKVENGILYPSESLRPHIKKVFGKWKNKKVKIPKERIISRNEEDFEEFEVDYSPLQSFYNKVIESVDHKPNISDVYIHYKDYKKLEKEMKKWFIQKGMNKGSYILKKNMSFLCLSMPEKLKDKWAKRNTIYIKVK